jgi:hypothetical protein
VLDEVVTAVATGAAGNVVAYMLNGRVDALRSWVARIFRRGTDQEQLDALQTLEYDLAALADERASEAELIERWTSLLVSYLSAHPEARYDVEAMASSRAVGKTMNVGSQHNHGSGTFIGGDNYGNMDFRGKK